MGVLWNRIGCQTAKAGPLERIPLLHREETEGIPEIFAVTVIP